MRYSIFNLVRQASPIIAAGVPRGATRLRNPRTTSSSSAEEGMAWRRPTISPRCTASRTSRSSRRAGSAPAMPAAIPPSSARIIFCPATIPFYELSMKLWEGLEQDLNYNAMVSQRGVSISIIPTRSAMPTRGAETACCCMGWTPSCGCGGRAADAALSRFRQCALSHSRRLVAAPGRDGASRRGRLGICARGHRAAASTSFRTAR